MHKLRFHVPRKDVKRLFKELDVDGSKQVSLSELSAWLDLSSSSDAPAPAPLPVPVTAPAPASAPAQGPTPGNELASAKAVQRKAYGSRTPTLIDRDGPNHGSSRPGSTSIKATPSAAKQMSVHMGALQHTMPRRDYAQTAQIACARMHDSQISVVSGAKGSRPPWDTSMPASPTLLLRRTTRSTTAKIGKSHALSGDAYLPTLWARGSPSRMQSFVPKHTHARSGIAPTKVTICAVAGPTKGMHSLGNASSLSCSPSATSTSTERRRGDRMARSASVPVPARP